MFFGFNPIAFNLFCSQLGEGFTVIPDMVTPQYRGARVVSSTATSIFKVRMSTLKLLTDGVINSTLTPLCIIPARRSRAVPK